MEEAVVGVGGAVRAADGVVDVGRTLHLGAGEALLATLLQTHLVHGPRPAGPVCPGHASHSVQYPVSGNTVCVNYRKKVFKNDNFENSLDLSLRC